MSNPTIPAEGQKTRRAALAALASVPALAILPAMAVASPTSTAQLADLIAVHEASWDALRAADAAEDECLCPHDVRVSFLGRELEARGEFGTHREKLTRNMELSFRVAESMMIPTWLSPELIEAARVQLETKRAECLAEIEAAFAGFEAVERGVRAAEKVRDEAMVAVCGHRCGSADELVIKLRHLDDGGFYLEEEASAALYRSLLPEGMLDAV